MEERTFFEQDDVKVTNARFITGGQTFAMTNVTSVKPFVEKPNRIFGILLLVAGLLIAGNASIFAGLVVAAIGGAILYLQKPVFHVLLATSAGETKALKTTQRDYLDQIIVALNNAIVYRG